MSDLTREGASDAPVRILLAHGAGAGMEHAFLAELSRLLAGPDIEVVRFNFPYMSKRAQDGKRRPPDRQPVLLAYWREMVREFAHPRLFLAGKSMGGRMAAELFQDGDGEMNAAGLIVLGYPFHPPAKPDRWRGDWLTDGDHGFKPRKASGLSEQENLRLAAERIKGFVAATGHS